MISYRNRTVWITGASSGIGEATALRFAREGARLVLTSRNEQQLEDVAARCKGQGSPDVAVLPADLSRLDGLDALADKAWKCFGGIDVFFCNAGISQRGEAAETDLAVVQRIMDIDFFAPVALTRSLLPRMVSSGGGQFVAVSSLAGLFGTRGRSAYCSAKAALMRFFETVGVENRDKGICVTVIIPGRVRTGISLKALEADGGEHGKMDPGQASGISVEKAADRIFKAVARRRREKLIGGPELLMAYFKRFLPGLCWRISVKTKAL